MVARMTLGGVIAKPYVSEHSLFSRYSRDQRVEDNVHLATIGFEPVKKSDEALFQWKSYLGAHNLAPVNAVSTGLSNILRHW